MSQRSSPVPRSDLRGYVAARIESLRAVIDGTLRMLLGVSSLRALFPTLDNRHPSREVCQSLLSAERQREASLVSLFVFLETVVNDDIAVEAISLEMRGPRGLFRRASLDGLCGTMFMKHAGAAHSVAREAQASIAALQCEK